MGTRRRVLAILLSLALLSGAAWLSGGLEYGRWWLTNTEPPSLRLAGPPDVVRGSVRVGVELAPGDRARIVETQLDAHPLAPEQPLTIDTTVLPDGPHRLSVTAEDLSWRRNRATAELDLRSDNTPPQLALESRPSPVSQGRTWRLRVHADEPAAIHASLGGTPLDLQAGDGFGWAIVGFGPAAEPRALPLVLSGADPVGNRGEQHTTVQVIPTDFARDSVEVSASLLPLLQPRVRAEEDARLAPTYAQVTRPRLWDGPFTMPVRGEIVTPFGAVRSYNKNPFEGNHAGVDIAAPAGQAVRAPARGKVALIDRVRLRGNVAILDHGLGVFTTYAHLSAVDVHPGQEVRRGQPFAKVGTTGLSEGPHLHWELWVGGANVDPLEWVEQSFP